MRKVKFPLAPQTDEAQCRSKYIELLNATLAEDDSADDISSDEYYYRRPDQNLNQYAATITSKIERRKTPQRSLDNKEIQLQSQSQQSYRSIKSNRVDSIASLRGFSHHKLSVDERQFLRKFSLKKSSLVPHVVPESRMKYWDTPKRTLSEEAVFIAFNKLEEILRCFYSTIKGNINEIPYRLFSWSLCDFFDRHENGNVVYMDVLPRKFNDFELQQLKKKCDVYELLKYVKFLYKTWSTEPEIEARETIMEVFMEAKNFTRIEYVIEILLEQNGVEHKDLIWDMLIRKHTKPDTVKKKVRKQMQQLRTEENEIEPILNRYKIGWLHNIVNEEAMKVENLISKTELVKLKNDIFASKYTAESSLNKYYQEMTEYKFSYENLFEQYEEDFENIDTQVNVLRQSINAITDELQYRTDQVNMFRRRIAEVEEAARLEQLKKHMELILEIKRKKELLAQLKESEGENATRREKNKKNEKDKKKTRKGKKKILK